MIPARGVRDGWGGRGGEEWREQRRFNDAADYAANDLLLRAGLQPVLGWLHNPAYARLGMETIYARLPAGPGSGGGLLGDVLVRTGRTPEEAEELRRRIREVMVDAREFARSQGRLPGYLDELVGRALAARVPWGNVLRRFMEGVGAGDYSWEHPDETMLGRDIVLPTLMTRRRVDHIVVAQDTSGSVSTEELRQCGGELSEILAEVDFGELHYIEVDTAVARVSTLERGDLPLELRAAGRGGTSFEPAFRWVEERDLRPSCLIYLTDMKGAFPERAPAYPVLWAALPLAGARPPQPPFGELVEIS